MSIQTNPVPVASPLWTLLNLNLALSAIMFKHLLIISKRARTKPSPLTNCFCTNHSQNLTQSSQMNQCSRCHCCFHAGCATKLSGEDQSDGEQWQCSNCLRCCHCGHQLRLEDQTCLFQLEYCATVKVALKINEQEGKVICAAFV
jgi:hypothetical protein